MMAKHWFHYRTDGGIRYDLGCEFMISNRKLHLVGADLYRAEGDYAGYWDRQNMPLPLIRELERWLKGDPAAAPMMLRASRSK